MRTKKSTSSNATEEIENLASITIMEKINELLRESELKEDALDKACPYALALAMRYGITHDAAIFLSAIIETAYEKETDNHTIARFFQCSNMQMYHYYSAIESLVNAGIIRIYCSRGRKTFNPSRLFISRMMENQPFEKPEFNNLDIHTFLEEFTRLTDERVRYDLEYELFIYDMKRLIWNNLHLPICQFLINELNEDKHEDSATIFILRACAIADMYNDFSISIYECARLMDSSMKQKVLNKVLENAGTKDRKIKVFEPAITIESPLADDKTVSMTKEFCKKYLKGVNYEKKQTDVATEGIIPHDRITEKRLFYNNEEKVQIEELGKLLKPRNFNRIQKQLRENGYRTGFACLFYGAPGTGKTESAMQLAKATGRDIIPVDLSQIRDKFVGESEKRTKAIFDDYHKSMKHSKLAPILLLNEADGLLAKRFSSVGQSTDQMENTMQNIILQEMESFEGILIATTNLTCNLDAAFDRRFLYKVEFHKPSKEARQSIWTSMIRDLRAEDAKIVAEEFELSGGEIENIARKYVVDNILHNKKTDVDKLRNICKMEKMTRGESRKLIGF